MKYATITSDELQLWAQLNDVSFNGVKTSSNITSDDGISKGGGLLSTTYHESEDELLSINRDLILSKETVLQCAKTDQHLKQLVEALGDFVQVPRKAIIVFLLFQMTICDPELAGHSIGVHSSFTDYYRALPKQIPLPTFMAAEERVCLIGTSLHEALRSKMSSLEKEFELLRDRTESVEWCQKAWWNEESGRLSFRDWLLVDAMYRSRALQLPRGAGDAMVPVLDMANHAADDRYNAKFEIGEDGQVLLLVRDGKQIRENEEVTITYGCGGATEMIFSYGFLEENVRSAREMFLSLSAPEDDPLRLAKLHFANEAPGIRIFTNAGGEVCWESSFVWWACVNEEDGLDFKVLQTVDGGRELQALWKGIELDPDNLRSTLMEDLQKNLFRLRATVMVQERVKKQGELLSASQAKFELDLHHVREEFVHENIRRLRELELDLLTESYDELEKEKHELLQSRTVAEFLRRRDSEILEPEPHAGQEDEDFS